MEAAGIGQGASPSTLTRMPFSRLAVSNFGTAGEFRLLRNKVLQAGVYMDGSTPHIAVLCV